MRGIFNSAQTPILVGVVLLVSGCIQSLGDEINGDRGVRTKIPGIHSDVNLIEERRLHAPDERKNGHLLRRVYSRKQLQLRTGLNWGGYRQRYYDTGNNKQKVFVARLPRAASNAINRRNNQRNQVPVVIKVFKRRNPINTVVNPSMSPNLISDVTTL